MISLLPVLWPELLLAITAGALFLLGISPQPAARRAAPVLAASALAVVFFGNAISAAAPLWDTAGGSASPTLYVFHFAVYIKMLGSGIGVLLVFLAWPSGDDAFGNSALEYGYDAGEFFGLILLSIAGIFLVAGANDIILLFLGIELASLPTYIMVSISRPLPEAQEAGVKYFFLGAMSAAIMLFGFSYLYGSTGLTHLDAIAALFRIEGIAGMTAWQLLAVVMVIAGVAFKLAAVPLHAYAGDVYQGAATPVTALLAFVPKTSGMVALIKILFAASGGIWAAPDVLMKLLWAMAILTMSFGNVLALLQSNIKRVLAYSSVAHSGYMLVGITALLAARGRPDIQKTALAGVLFYLAAYGIMNIGPLGVLMLLPSRRSAHSRNAASDQPPPTGASAETYDDIAGQGYSHIGLGLAMAVCCFSLTGIPITVGFLGKYFLVQPAWAIAHATSRQWVSSHMGWLVVILMINAAVSAGYYLRIVAAMFLRPADSNAPSSSQPGLFSLPAAFAVALSVAGTLACGLYLPAANALSTRAQIATQIRDNDQPAIIMTQVSQRN
jgi:NADH-quinone oxidoreductase subunit N